MRSGYNWEETKKHVEENILNVPPFDADEFDKSGFKYDTKERRKDIAEALNKKVFESYPYLFVKQPILSLSGLSGSDLKKFWTKTKGQIAHTDSAAYLGDRDGPDKYSPFRLFEKLIEKEIWKKMKILNETIESIDSEITITEKKKKFKVFFGENNTESVGAITFLGSWIEKLKKTPLHPLYDTVPERRHSIGGRRRKRRKSRKKKRTKRKKSKRKRKSKKRRRRNRTRRR